MSGLRSVSIACAALSVLTIITYAMALNSILIIKYFEAQTSKEDQKPPWFAEKDVEIEFQKEEKTMIAVHVLIIMCSILEIIPATASVRTAKAMAKEPQDTQVGVVILYAVNKLDMTMIKELMIRKHYMPNFSNASCSLSAFILEGENKWTLRTPDVNDVIFEKIIQVLAWCLCLGNAKFFNSELHYFERILEIRNCFSPKWTLATRGFFFWFTIKSTSSPPPPKALEYFYDPPFPYSRSIVCSLPPLYTRLTTTGSPSIHPENHVTPWKTSDYPQRWKMTLFVT